MSTPAPEIIIDPNDSGSTKVAVVVEDPVPVFIPYECDTSGASNDFLISGVIVKEN